MFKIRLSGEYRWSGVLLCAAALSFVGACDRGTGSIKPLTPTASNTSSLPSDDELRRRLDDVLDYNNTHRRLNLRDHAAWQIVHGALAFEGAFQIEDRDGQLVSAIDYLLNGGRMTGWTMERGVKLSDNPPRYGLRAVLEQGSKTGQGHADQWLGYLADCEIKIDQKIKAGDETFTLEDLLLQAEYDVPFNVEREYSWTLMGLTTYRPTSYEWTAGDGNPWSIAKLMEIEVGHDLGVSACGGTHRMCGITIAYNRHVASGGAIEGPWAAAKKKIEDAVLAAKQYQNPSGGLSTNWFQRPGDSPDVKESLGCTGHALEFVVLASTDEQLHDPWVRRSVVYLCNLFDKTKSVDLECGALYHALHGLVLYRERVFGKRTFPASTPAAVKEPTEPQPIETAPAKNSPDEPAASTDSSP